MMGVAIDTVGFTRTAGTAADTAPGSATSVSGDSFTVRSFPVTATAKLEALFFDAVTAGGTIQITSPMLHDNVRGIRLSPDELPAQFLLPPEIAQKLISQDTLAVAIEVLTASEIDVGAMSIYYSDLLGTSARLKMWADIKGNIKNIKPMSVVIAEGATAGVWIDQVITGTEDLLHANKDYAILGIVTDTPGVAVGIKGVETGNLRICAPCVIRLLDSADYFIKMSESFGTPHIPIINSANKDSIYASLLSDKTGANVNAQFILAELVNNLTG